MIPFSVWFNRFQLRKTDWMLSLMMTSLGLFILENEEAFSGSIALAALLQIASAPAVGTCCLIAGGLRLVLLSIKLAFPPTRAISKYARLVASIICALVWSQLVLSVYMVTAGNVGRPLFPWFLIFELVNCYSIAAERDGHGRAFSA